MKRVGRAVSSSFIRIMLLLGMFGVGLWVLAQIVSLAGRSAVTAPVGTVASRYRQFATTGS